MANEPIPDLSAMLNGILQDPAQMARLQEMAVSLGLTAPTASADAANAPTAASADSPVPPTDLPVGLPSLLGGSVPSKHRPDQRTALLMALRPYLSDSRREMIDAIVNFSRLGSMLGGGGRD